MSMFPRCWFSLFVISLAVVLGCGGGSDDGSSSNATAVNTFPLLPIGEPPKNPPLSPEHLDTMRAMMARLRIERDEYWSGYGGVLGSAEARVWYLTGHWTLTHGMYIMDRLDRGRSRLRHSFGVVPTDTVEVVCTEPMEAYTQQTGREWWNYSRIEGNRITLQPVPVLRARALMDIAIDHEYFVWALNNVSRGAAPRWLVFGCASEFAVEEALLVAQIGEFPDDPVVMDVDEIERILARDDDRRSSRIAYFNAFKMAERLMQQHGEASVGAFFAALGEGMPVNSASTKALGIPWDDAVREASAWSDGWTR